MLKKRIIPSLLLKNSRMVKSIQFSNFRDVGDPVSAAKIYNSQNADELVFIDIEATRDGRSCILDILNAAAKECFMPLCAGGGINSTEDIRKMLISGADKIIINSAVFTNYNLITEAANLFGSQCIVIGIDVKIKNGDYQLYSHAGTKQEEVTLLDHIEKVQSAGAGEIFLTSIDNDGMMQGYDTNLLMKALNVARIPVIISGGAANYGHIVEVLKMGADAASMASMYHFADNNPIRTRSFLRNAGIPMRTI